MPQCNGGCGTQIKFDPNRRSQSGKQIPLEMDGTPHQCPNNPYYQQQRQEQQPKRVPSPSTSPEVYSKITDTMDAVLGNTLDIAMKLDKLVQQYEELLPRFDQLVSMYQAKFEPAEQQDPNDDDGDSLREEGDYPGR